MIKPALRATLAHTLLSVRRALVEFWRDIHPGIRKAFLTCVLLAGGISTLLLIDLFSDERNVKNDVTRIRTEANQTLRTIRRDLESMRDSLSVDSVLRFALVAQPSQDELFDRLIFRTRDWVSIPDELQGSNEFIVQKGAALYSRDAKLLAWNSGEPAVFQFDSILPEAAGIDRRSTGVYTTSGPIYTYLTAFNKLQIEGTVVGYVVTKSLLAVQNPAAPPELRVRSFLDPLRQQVERDILLQFNVVAQQQVSDNDWTRFSLYAKEGDPATYVARVSVSDVLTDTSSVQHWLARALMAVLGLIVLLILGWGLTFLQGSQGSTYPILRRTLYSLYLVALILLARYALLAFDPFAALLSPAYQDSHEFGSYWGYGIVRDPLQLFTSSMFVALGSVMLWLIWMPRKRLVRDDRTNPSIQLIVRREAFVLVLFAVGAALGSQVLINVLGQIVELLVLNAKVRFLVVRQVIPTSSELLMYLSILTIGVGFLFIGTLLLTFALRAVVFLVSRRFRLSTRVVLGTMILTLGLLVCVILFRDAMVGIGFRVGATGMLLALSTAIILADAFFQSPLQDSPSFLYRLPRSSRAVLFILTGSAVLMSPLIAQKGVQRDILNAQVIRDQAQSSVASLGTDLASSLDIITPTLRQWIEADTSASLLNQLGFLIYASEFSAQRDRSVIIQVQDLQGRIISRFSSGASNEDILRSKAIIDTMARLVQLRRTAMTAPVFLPCFTRTCDPLVAASRLVPLRQTPGDLVVTVATWSDLPGFKRESAPLNLLKGENPLTTTTLIQEGEFIVAHYRPGYRVVTNAPSIDVPADLPPGVRLNLRSGYAARQTEINSARYYSQYFTLPIRGEAQSDRVLSVSVPLPSISRVLELALRLNAIGLTYGIAIAMIVILVRQLTTRRIRLTLRFRDRIFLIVLAIALLPLVVVTSVTQDLLRNRAGLEDRDALLRDAQVLNDEFSRRFPDEARFSDTLLYQFTANLSNVLGRDLNVYSKDGLLLATSRPELYQSSVLASTLPPNVMQRVVFGRKAFVSERLTAANQTIRVGYRAVGSAEAGPPMAVLSVATLEEASRIEAEVARTTSLIYGTFAALGVVLLGIGAIFAARVALPIMRLIQATEHVAEGKLGTTIKVDREDEIGELMHAFNSMTGELQKSRERIAQSERELAWKEMARQVAHEIKNPLTPMRLSVQHLEHAQEMKDPNFSVIFKRVMRTLGEQIELLTRIATEFSRFGEMPRRRYGAVSVRKAAESAVALFDSERHRIRFIIDVPNELSPIHADEQEFKRTLVNLIRNAIQAIEGWGVIVIRATEDKGMIHLKLTDTGAGMTEDTLTRVFDPNFSTKTSGMGLGLAIVKKTITDMSGTIMVESKLGHGTTFFIDLPARKSPIEDEGANNE